MKITEVELYVVDPTGGAATYNDEPQNVWTFVRVLTDEGVHGWGESTNFPANGSLIIADAIRHLKRAYELQPDAEIAAHLGEVLWVTGEKAEARRVWEEGTRKDAKNRALKRTIERFKP